MRFGLYLPNQGSFGDVEVLASLAAQADEAGWDGGRLIIGAGLGSPPSQFTAFGHDPDLRARGAMLDEFLEMVTLLWSGEEITYAGTYCSAHGVSMEPPRQRPRIPIWIGADARHAAPRRRAARWDGGFVRGARSCLGEPPDELVHRYVS